MKGCTLRRKRSWRKSNRKGEITLPLRSLKQWLGYNLIG
jgi:hypothetical protein